MVTREKFIKIMEQLTDVNRRENEALDKLSELGVRIDCDYNWTRDDIIVDLLEADLRDDEEWISYFLWEREGKLDGAPCVFVDNGKTPVDTSDWGKVYDFIVQRDDDETEDTVSDEPKPTINIYTGYASKSCASCDHSFHDTVHGGLACRFHRGCYVNPTDCCDYFYPESFDYPKERWFF